MPRAADDGANGEGECRLLVFPDDAREAEYLADGIERWMEEEGLAPSDVCILVRKLADPFSRELRGALEHRRIQSRVENERQDLLTEPIAKLTCASLRLASQPRDAESWKALMEMTLRARGLAEEDEAASAVGREIVETISALREPLAAASTAEEIAELISAMIEFLGEPTFRRLHPQYSQGDFFDTTIASCAGALADARGRKANWTEALDDFLGLHCIPIMTITKSKGLEFHTVIVLGLEDYAFHHHNNLLNEDECNFFVAFSRARKRVIFTFAGQRTGRWQQREKIARYYRLLDDAGVSIEVIKD